MWPVELHKQNFLSQPGNGLNKMGLTKRSWNLETGLAFPLHPPPDPRAGRYGQANCSCWKKQQLNDNNNGPCSL